MILKKPYVIMIKYFRLIHVFLGLGIIYSIFKINSLLCFFNSYLSTQSSVVGQDLQGSLFSKFMFIIPIIIFAISLLLLWLMIRKKKPFRFYLYNSLVYLFVFFVFLYVYIFLNQMSDKVVDIVTVRVVRDILVIIISLQSVSLLVTFIRIIGFDIKNFEFMSDLQKLEISEDDREEIEVDLSFDSNESKRKRRRKLRYLKYSYKENQMFINFILIVLGIFLAIYGYSKTGIYTRINKQGSLLSTDYYKFSVDNTYLVNSSYKGIKITDNYLVVIDLKIANKGLVNKILTGNFKLKIDEEVYSTTNKYDKYLIDMGKVYDGKIISGDLKNYLIVYEIPSDAINKDMKLVYYEQSKDVKVKLKPVLGEKISKDFQLGETIEIDDKDSITINSYEIQDYYTLNYDFCIKNDCYNSVQYIVPAVNTNYDKVILKLNGVSSHKESSNYSNFNNVMLGIGFIQYTKSDVTYVSKIESVSNLKKSENNVYYYEIDKNVLDADSVKIVFNTRKCQYSYILK